MTAEYDTLEQFDRDQHYIDEHYVELWKRYPNNWIGVYQGKFIMFGRTPEELHARLEYNGYAPQNVARRFMSRDPDLIL